MKRIRQKAQSILELALCLATIVTAIGGMTIYVRRSLQARYRAVVLYYANQAGQSHQYEPYYTREANTSEAKDGWIKEGYPESSKDVVTTGSGWRHTPLPKRWP